MRTIIVIVEPEKDEIEIFCGSAYEFGLILDVVAHDLSEEQRASVKAHIEEHWREYEVPIFQNKEGYFLQLRFE